jgi:predicted secreted hydrolase
VNYRARFRISFYLKMRMQLFPRNARPVGLFFLAALLFGRSGGELALPGYRYQFPRDYFSHPSYQTEWWYYTGKLTSQEGATFGFELTFFRTHSRASESTEHNAVWFPSEIFIAHFAITDVRDRRFYHQERVNRGGPGLAGIDMSHGKIWNGNWSARFLAYEPVRQRLEAVSENAHLLLTLTPQKPVVIHGIDGVSQKGPKPGEASHYFSLTRIAASGALSLNGRNYKVSGLAWMDREFFSDVSGDPVSGWDWMCIQLNNGQDLMLYRLHLKDGTIGPFSSATFVAASGGSEFLDSHQFSLTPLKTWHSSATGADYPVSWKINVRSKSLSLMLTTPIVQQELVNRVTRNYWEGLVRYSGTEKGQPVEGDGYLEMTGYDQ